MSEPEWPWHAGEVALQHSVGLAGKMADLGRRMIRDHMPDQHRDFYSQLPFVVLGTVDGENNIWATIKTGVPGFMLSPDPKHLTIKLTANTLDPAEGGIQEGAAIGLLGIDLLSRRRNRMNGQVQFITNGISITVEHAFGNCPQYIQRRECSHLIGSQERESAPIRLHTLDAATRAIIAKADTFFVASSNQVQNGHRQIDVSHRGGNAGFVRSGDDGVLTIPDFAGNRHFNTLGNILTNPRAGLVFADFETGDLLQLSGAAEIILESPDIALFEKAERLWRFRPEVVVLRRRALPLRWSFIEWSPYSLKTGRWQTTPLSDPAPTG